MSLSNAIVSGLILTAFLSLIACSDDSAIACGFDCLIHPDLINASDASVTFEAGPQHWLVAAMDTVSDCSATQFVEHGVVMVDTRSSNGVVDFRVLDGGGMLLDQVTCRAVNPKRGDFPCGRYEVVFSVSSTLSCRNW